MIDIVHPLGVHRRCPERVLSVDLLPSATTEIVEDDDDRSPRDRLSTISEELGSDSGGNNRIYRFTKACRSGLGSGKSNGKARKQSSLSQLRSLFRDHRPLSRHGPLPSDGPSTSQYPKIPATTVSPLEQIASSSFDTSSRPVFSTPVPVVQPPASTDIDTSIMLGNNETLSLLPMAHSSSPVSSKKAESFEDGTSTSSDTSISPSSSVQKDESVLTSPPSSARHGRLSFSFHSRGSFESGRGLKLRPSTPKPASAISLVRPLMSLRPAGLFGFRHEKEAEDVPDIDQLIEDTSQMFCIPELCSVGELLAPDFPHTLTSDGVESD